MNCLMLYKIHQEFDEHVFWALEILLMKDCRPYLIFRNHNAGLKALNCLPAYILYS